MRNNWKIWIIIPLFLLVGYFLYISSNLKLDVKDLSEIPEYQKGQLEYKYLTEGYLWHYPQFGEDGVQALAFVSSRYELRALSDGAGVLFFCRETNNPKYDKLMIHIFAIPEDTVWELMRYYPITATTVEECYEYE